LSTAYVAGGPIPLGILVTLWKEGKLLDKCQACGGVVHIIGAGGALSMNSWWGYCAECGAPQHGSKKTFWADTCAPIHRMWQQYPNRTIIRRGTHAAYIRKGNRVERVVPDVVVARRIEAPPLAALIEELRRPEPLPQAHEGPLGGPVVVGNEARCLTPVAAPAVGGAAGAFHFGKTQNGEPALSPRAISEAVVLPPDPDLPPATHPQAPRPGSPLPLVPTGLATLDRCLSGGLPSGALTYVATDWRGDARALMLTICGRHLLARPGAVAYAACERPESVMATLAKGRVSSNNPYPLARATAEDRAEYEAALRAVEEASFYFVPIPLGHSMYLGDLIASVRLVREAEPLGLLLISDLSALRLEEAGGYPPGPVVVRTLQELAASLRAPVVVALSPRGEHGAGSNEPFTLPQEEVQRYVRSGTDACLLLGRLPFPDHRVRHLTVTIHVASHPLGMNGGVVHYDFDHFTKNLHEMEIRRSDPESLIC
jgi:hypothetical protein